MKPPFALLALAGALAAPIALAQVPTPVPQGARTPANPAGGPRPLTSVPPLSPSSAAPPAGAIPFRQNAGAARSPAQAPSPEAATPAKPTTDGRVFESSTALPAPTLPDQIPAATIALPTDPIEPYLLTREAGPFMVMAKTFKGPEAERYALALVLELRNEYQLPAYILRSRDFPMRSNLRNIPPTAVREMEKPYVTEPERSRTHDEAVVLVGNEKTIKGADALLHRVKKIKPRCLNGMPSIFHWRQGLHTAMRTTNPYVPAQDIFPRKNDPLVMKLNSGPYSLMHCPGQYSLQVAEFGGRATFVSNDKNSKDPLDSDSPLERAFDDAEMLAEMLAKDPEVQKTGYQPYVFHDLTASRVMIGAFSSPNDPAAARLRETLLKLAVPLSQKRKKSDNHTMIVPAPYLTDIEVLKASAR